MNKNSRYNQIITGEESNNSLYDNTASVKQLAEAIDKINPEWWVTKPGNDTIVYKKGDKVITTNSSTLKSGIVLTIQDTMLDSGYAKYLAGGCWHRQNDFKPYEENTK